MNQDNGWKEKLKDITHRLNQDDFRGSCPDNCFQCLKDKSLISLIESLLIQEIKAEERASPQQNNLN